MALLRLILLVSLLGLSTVVAQQRSLLSKLATQDFSDHSQDHAGEGIEVRFVPPVVQGTVSLGIFDSMGNLMRTLCEEWTFNRFHVGLNGLFTSWDGKSDSGQRVPPGVYKARGFIVGDVDVAGVAFHFNDWIETENSPRIVHVAAQQILPDGDILLAARLSGNKGALVRYSPKSEVRWHTIVSKTLPEQIPQTSLATADHEAFVLLDGKLRVVSLEDGKEIECDLGEKPISAIAAGGRKLVLYGEGEVRIFNLPEFSAADAPKDIPGEIVSLAVMEDGMLAALQDGSVWTWGEKRWTKLDLPNRVIGVASGVKNAFWVLEDRVEEGFCVAQYSPEEGRLAEWAPNKEDGTPSTLTASAEKDFFALTFSSLEGQRTVGIRRNAEGSGWEFAVDKKITKSTEFGWRDGALVAMVGEDGELPNAFDVILTENPLDAEASRDLRVKVVAEKSGTAIASEKGLNLLGVSDSGSFNRVMLVAADKPDVARLFQGDGACVEEYEIKNLRDIYAFDAGDIVMDKLGEVPAPPPVEPEIDVPRELPIDSADD